jgi:hypothetical protein
VEKEGEKVVVGDVVVKENVGGGWEWRWRRDPNPTKCFAIVGLLQAV